MRRSLAALVSAVGVLTSCTAPTTPQAPPEPVSLTDALAMVRATDATRTYLEYLDQSARGGAEHATADSLPWAPDKTHLDLLIHPGRDTLATDETVAALARCVGEVEVAVFATRPSGVTFGTVLGV